MRSVLLILLLIILPGFLATASSSYPNRQSRIQRRRPPKKTVSLKNLFDPSGSLRLGYFERDKSFLNQKNYLTGATWLTLRPQKILGIKSYFEGNLQGSDLSRNSVTIGDLREGYLEKSFGKFDFKVGRQITVWGRADKINPTDNLSVRDFTKLVADDEDQRTGVFASQIVYNFGQWKLVGIWQPEWREPKYIVPPLPKGLGLVTSTPYNSADQFALKLDRSNEGLDFSLSYFNGFDKNPDFKVISILPTGILLSYDYKKIETYGLDFAFNLRSFGVRSEIAYTKTQNNNGLDPLIKNSFWYGVFGIDKSFFDSFSLNAQYLFRSIDNWTDPKTLSNPISQILAPQAQLNFNQQQNIQHGMSSRLSYKMFNDALETEVTYLVWFQKGDFLILPKITYALNDHWKMNIGGEYFLGSSDSFLGRFQDVSTVFAEIRYNF